MIHNRLLNLVLLVSLSGILGCSHPPERQAKIVSGRVYLDSIPFTGGTIAFHWSEDRIQLNAIRSDGTFSIPFISPEKATVTIHPFTPVSGFVGRTNHAVQVPPEEQDHLAKVESFREGYFPMHYSDPTTSTLTASGDSTFLELHLKSGDSASISFKNGALVGTRTGCLAPNIEGMDLQGKPFQLSDYRGKVVLLTFWGDWCILCRDRYPFQKSLVDKFKDKPFVLLGVNVDIDVREKGIDRNPQLFPGRSWWDGHLHGTVSSTWKISGLPNYVVIDHHGIIRSREKMGAELIPFLESLCQEACESKH